MKSELKSYRTHRPLLTGLVLIAVGCVFLAQRFGYIDSQQAWLVAPLAIAIGAIAELLKFNPTGLLKGCANLLLAFWLYALLAHWSGWQAQASWPLLLVVVGLNVIASAMSQNQVKNNDTSAK